MGAERVKLGRLGDTTMNMSISLCAAAGLGAFLTAASMAGAASAAVTISTDATSHMKCLAGLCKPTATDAVLNVKKLIHLLNTESVTIESGSTAKDIVVSASVQWVHNSALVLDAYRSLTIDALVRPKSAVPVTLTTNDGGTGGLLAFGSAGRVSFLSTLSPLTINGASYKLVNTIGELADVIGADGGTGHYALANDYSAAADGVYASSPVALLASTGTFEGLHNTISHLSIDVTSSGDDAGLFAETDGTVNDVILQGASVKKSGEGGSVGALSARNFGAINAVSVSGSVQSSVADDVGGLVGDNESGTIARCQSAASVTGIRAGGLVGEMFDGTIDSSFATGSVKAASAGSPTVGGLVGYAAAGSIGNSYATGTATGLTDANLGGLFGISSATIASVYASGAVKSHHDSHTGGVTGFDAGSSFADAYWDTTTTGITDVRKGAGNIKNDPGITGLSDTDLKSGLPTGFAAATWGEDASINGGLPYLLANPPS